MTRRRLARRLTSALIGAGVTTIGALAIAAMSGYGIDVELVVIAALIGAGAWLLLTAAIAGMKPNQRHASMNQSAMAAASTKAASDAKMSSAGETGAASQDAEPSAT